jgi:dimethylglycine dehydrogenase
MKKATIIGGGIAGASISRLLSKAGIKNVVLERGSQLTVGATWHAAGLVTRFASNSKLKKVHVRSLDIMTELQNKYDISLHTPGSIRIIEKNNKDRLLEAKQHLSMSMLYDNPEYKTELISANDIKNIHPYVNVSNIECGLYTPYDGDVDSTQLTNCLAKESKENGGKFIFNEEVIDIKKYEDKFVVNTNKNGYVSDILINCAGLWSRKISNMLNIHQPSMVIEHQYVITDDLNINKNIPVLRDLVGSSYIRKERGSFLIGPYENNCIVRTDLDNFSIPNNWNEMELFPDDIERITDNLVKAIELVPIIGEVGIKKIINGPTIWTGDSLPRVGMNKIKGYYDFNSLTYGIAQSLSLSEYLLEIIINKEQLFDAINYFNPTRYGVWTNDKYTEKKIKETYSYNNCITYPFENRSAGIEYINNYPLFQNFKNDGAKFGPITSGVAVPLFYQKHNENDIQVNDLKTFNNFPWTDKVMKETKEVLNNVGLSYSFFSKIIIKGNDAKKFLDKISISNIPKKNNNCKLSYFITDKGKLVSEFTICPINDYFYLVGNANNNLYDIEWLKSKIIGDVKIENHTDLIDILHIAGPKSKELLSNIDSRINDISFMKMKEINNFGLSNLNLNIFKLSFTGLEGYELHINRNDSIKLYEFIKNHKISKDLNMSLFGSFALNSLRIDKGFKTYADLDYSHYLDAGIEPFISKKKINKKYYDEVSSQKISCKFRIYTDKTYEWSVLGDSPILDDEDNLIGYVTSSALSARNNYTVGLGFIDKNKIHKKNCYIKCLGFNWKIDNILQS